MYTHVQDVLLNLFNNFLDALFINKTVEWKSQEDKTLMSSNDDDEIIMSSDEDDKTMN